jgi:hypothetical protein
MIVKKIKDLTHKEFEELRNIYLSTFPLENAKHLDIYLNHIYDMLKNDSRYHLYVAIKDSSRIGISLLYIFVLFHQVTITCSPSVAAISALIEPELVELLRLILSPKVEPLSVEALKKPLSY